MLRIRYSLRLLLVALTIVSLISGCLAWRAHRLQVIATKRDQAVEALGKAFEKLLPGFELSGGPGVNDSAKDFDQAVYDFWLTECKSEGKLGSYQAGYYSSTRQDTVPATIKHFGDALEPLGFIPTGNHQEKLSHGARTTQILIDSDTGVEADIAIVEGPNNLKFISIDVGSE